MSDYQAARKNMVDCQNIEGEKGDRGEDLPQWSLPLRIRTTETGTRLNTAIPSSHLSVEFVTRSYALTSQEKFGITFLVLSEEKPLIELHNNCNFTVYYGQTLIGVTIAGKFC